ncbi:MAG TPA: tRNA lysidine(34) synthetase TilS [Candidatus Moranbacteria bacterium]|jgi:tRNA(Ile)-lysidine synthase|nr:tRNA lysidine(34) synthetase TilS [Candidatus Moranbacteria bacterium]HOF42266.1 tRNA lysidine(34) synthetase TilS [Candidatus Moranbacteria bacterium]HPX94663.1 tRNA lysidine(34) synthetase TilS [Candidatus Moranbacteria bacterium]HQB59841.1 tRNA lysidine(34) synthetase TilS [Candidatus Moranbacteria bacterium]
MQLIKNIQNFAFQNELWKEGARIILGVSGGPDSVFLLDFFASIAPKYNLKLHIAHVNYGLRGKDSQKDEKLVRELAKKYGTGLSLLKPKKAQYKGNLENTLRKIRYDFFESTRKKLGFDLIAVAHTMDDQAETVLMRILRGTGLSGLGAMKPKTGNIIRPFLQTDKNLILAYLKQNKLKYGLDASNLDTKLMRNRVRHKLLPYLERNFNPSIKKTIGEWSLAVADDYAFIEKSAERFAKAACKNKCVTFSASTFEKLHPSIRRQVLRSIIKKLKGTTEDVKSNQVEEMLKIIKSAKNKSQVAIIGGLKILKKGDKVEIIPA